MAMFRDIIQVVAVASSLLGTIYILSTSSFLHNDYCETTVSFNNVYDWSFVVLLFHAIMYAVVKSDLVRFLLLLIVTSFFGLFWLYATSIVTKMCDTHSVYFFNLRTKTFKYMALGTIVQEALLLLLAMIIRKKKSRTRVQELTEQLPTTIQLEAFPLEANEKPRLYQF
jgi:hypothetical protein